MKRANTNTFKTDILLGIIFVAGVIILVSGGTMSLFDTTNPISFPVFLVGGIIMCIAGFPLASSMTAYRKKTSRTATVF